MAKIGCCNFVIAPISAYTPGSAPTYGAGMKVGSFVRYQIDWNRSNAKIFGDNILIESDNGATSGTITIGTTTISTEGLKKMLGYVESGSTGEKVYTLTGDSAPIIGCGFVDKESGDGSPVYYGHWIYRAQFGMNESADTRRDATEYQTPEMTGDVLGAIVTSGGKVSFEDVRDFTTEAAAIAWVNAKANISASSTPAIEEPAEEGETGSNTGGNTGSP